MANARTADAPAEEQRGGWYKTLVNAIMIYFALNTVTSLIGGKFGGQKNVTSGDESVKPAAAAAVPALWSLGTKMVPEGNSELMLGYENLSK